MQSPFNVSLKIMCIPVAISWAWTSVAVLDSCNRVSLKPGGRSSGRNSVLSEVPGKVSKTGIASIWIYWMLGMKLKVCFVIMRTQS